MEKATKSLNTEDTITKDILKKNTSTLWNAVNSQLSSPLYICTEDIEFTQKSPVLLEEANIRTQVDQWTK